MCPKSMLTLKEVLSFEFKVRFPSGLNPNSWQVVRKFLRVEIAKFKSDRLQDAKSRASSETM